MKLLIKKYRRYRRMTQRTLAEKSGITQSYLSQLESNKYHKMPTITTLLQIGNVLEVCPALLVSYDCDNCFLSIKNKVKCKDFLIKEATDRLELFK